MNCPVCQSQNVKLFVEKNSHKLYLCSGCDLLYVWPTPAHLDTVYSKQYFKTETNVKVFGYIDYERDKESTKGTFVKYLEIIESKRTPGKIFDIGAATGFFLDIARKRNWKTSGIDISEYAASVAHDKGHNVFAGKLKDMEVGGEYDVVTMWDVFEHVEDPKKYMRKTNMILKHDGILVINTIDKNSLWAKAMGKRWHLIIPPEHIFYYSQKSLKMLFENNGFEIIMIKKIGKKFGLPYIFKMLYHWQRLTVWDHLYKYFSKNEFFRDISVPINLRDNIFILAKKVRDI